MTYEETITALELCGDENNCTKCPFRDKRVEPDISCAEEMMRSAAEQMKKLKADNEYLKKQNKDLVFAFRAAEMEREIALQRAEEAMEKWTSEVPTVIKRFVEKLKNATTSVVLGGQYRYEVITKEGIDEVAVKFTEHKQTVSMIDGHIEE